MIVIMIKFITYICVVVKVGIEIHSKLPRMPLYFLYIILLLEPAILLIEIRVLLYKFVIPWIYSLELLIL